MSSNFSLPWLHILSLNTRQLSLDLSHCYPWEWVRDCFSSKYHIFSTNIIAPLHTRAILYWTVWYVLCDPAILYAASMLVWTMWLLEIIMEYVEITVILDCVVLIMIWSYYAVCDIHAILDCVVYLRVYDHIMLYVILMLFFSMWCVLGYCTVWIVLWYCPIMLYVILMLSTINEYDVTMPVLDILWYDAIMLYVILMLCWIVWYTLWYDPVMLYGILMLHCTVWYVWTVLCCMLHSCYIGLFGVCYDMTLLCGMWYSCYTGLWYVLWWQIYTSVTMFNKWLSICKSVLVISNLPVTIKLLDTISMANMLYVLYLVVNIMHTLSHYLNCWTF